MRRPLVALVGIAILSAAPGLQPAEKAGPEKQSANPGRLQRTNLLQFRNASGQLRQGSSVDEWALRRKEILNGMMEIMGPLPGNEKRVPLQVTVERAETAGTYIRRSITYTSEPGSRVPAWLLIPQKVLSGTEKAPAVLCLHPTDNVNGHNVVVGLGGRANRQYAQELAERGYVTIAPAYPLLANYQPDVLGLGHQSGTMKAIWDNIRAVDLLQSLPFVDGEAIGAIGHSLGGHNSVYTAVFDQRIKVVVSSCGLDSYLDYYSERPEVWNPGKGWTQLRYMPKLADYKERLEEIPFDFHEMIGALAPRPTLIIAPLHDGNFKWRSVDRVAAAASQVYELHEAKDSLRVLHPDCPHDFPDDMREAAYEWLDSVLR